MSNLIRKVGFCLANVDLEDSKWCATYPTKFIWLTVFYEIFPKVEYIALERH